MRDIPSNDDSMLKRKQNKPTEERQIENSGIHTSIPYNLLFLYYPILFLYHSPSLYDSSFYL